MEARLINKLLLLLLPVPAKFAHAPSLLTMAFGAVADDTRDVAEDPELGAPTLGDACSVLECEEDAAGEREGPVALNRAADAPPRSL